MEGCTLGIDDELLKWKDFALIGLEAVDEEEDGIELSISIGLKLGCTNTFYFYWTQTWLHQQTLT